MKGRMKLTKQKLTFQKIKLFNSALKSGNNIKANGGLCPACSALAILLLPKAM
jgi:hypothetical protein